MLKFLLKFLPAFLLILTTSAGEAQSPYLNPGDECVLKGVVVNAAGGEPLRKAIVSLCRAGDSSGCTGAVTDATGQFELKVDQPGRYLLSAACTGYVSQQYGQQKPGGSGEVLDLSLRQTLSGLSIRLIPASAIYGNVYDENGAPVANVVVSELHVDYAHGQRQLRAGTTALTNDRGEYRLWGLNPGIHFILAEYNLQRLANIRTDIGYLPTFYPDVLDAAHAAPIVVQAGDEYSGASIDLQPAHTVRVRGHVFGGGSNVHVFLLLRDTTVFGDLVPPVYAQVRDGEYQLYNVTPGAYYLYASGQDMNGPMVSRVPVEVADTDLEHVDIILQQAFKLSGTVTVEGLSHPSQPPIQITLSPRKGRILLGQTPSTWTNPNGSFVFESVYPGDYDLEVESLGGSYYLKSVKTADYDVLERGISTEFHQRGPMNIFIGRNGATVDGVVSNGEPYSGGTVVLVPDPPNRDKTHLYKLTATDHAGHFRMEGVPPGDYKVFAWESVEHAAYASSDFLQPFELRGESAHVSEGSHVTVTLNLIPETEVR
jgi:hypothetical protein